MFRKRSKKLIIIRIAFSKKELIFTRVKEGSFFAPKYLQDFNYIIILTRRPQIKDEPIICMRQSQQQKKSRFFNHSFCNHLCQWQFSDLLNSEKKKTLRIIVIEADWKIFQDFKVNPQSSFLNACNSVKIIVKMVSIC